MNKQSSGRVKNVLQWAAMAGLVALLFGGMVLFALSLGGTPCS